MAFSGRVFFMLVLFPFVLWGQNSKIDALKQQLEGASGNIERSDVLHLLASENWDYSFETSLRYAKKALSLSQQAHYRKGIVVALSDIGLYHFFKGDINKAVAFYHKALREANNQNYG